MHKSLTTVTWGRFSMAASANVAALCPVEVQKHRPEVVPVVGMFSLFARSLLWLVAEGV